MTLKHIYEAQNYFFCDGKKPLETWAEKAEALLQAFGLSVGSCGLANVLTTVRVLV